MPSLRDKLREMADASRDFSGEDAPAPQPVPREAGVGDQTHAYDLSQGLGGLTLGDFAACDPDLFFGLNDGAPRPFSPGRVLFLDTETTGLYGAAVQAFLIGLGYFDGRCFKVRQLLMRDVVYEEDLLDRLEAIWRDFDVVVTFNGKSYDLPLLKARRDFLRKPTAPPAVHIDLLHPARRIYRLRIESCALSNIERRVFLSPREDDIDGAEIPGRYFHYLRCGDPRLLDDILVHNRRDVVTMPLLAAAMCRALASPAAASASADQFSIGRYYLRQSDPARAETFFTSVGDGVWRLPALWALSLTRRRAGDLDGAVDCWLAILDRTPDYCPALVEMAKYCEHAARDPGRALCYCDAALKTGMGKTRMREALEKRRERLLARADASARGEARGAPKDE